MLVMANSIYTELAPLRILGLFILLWLPSSSALPIEARQALDDGAGALGEDAKMSSELQVGFVCLRRPRCPLNEIVDARLRLVSLGP